MIALALSAALAGFALAYLAGPGGDASDRGYAAILFIAWIPVFAAIMASRARRQRENGGAR
jgi:hypothetical protein